MPQDRPNQPPASLIKALQTGGYLAGAPAVRALGGGRSNLVWLLANNQPQGAPLVLKLFPDRDANPLFDNDAAREIVCLNALGPRCLAPRLLGHGRVVGGDWILYRHIPGHIWRTDAAAVGGLLGTLHQSPVPHGLPSSPSGSRVLEQQTHRILDLCGQRNAFASAQFDGSVGPAPRRCLIHGDPVPGNIIDTGTRLSLIDWQCPSHGDPCEDLAMFLSPAMQYVYRGTPLSEEDVFAFLNAYPDRHVVERYCALKPWFHRRMAAYCLWQSERGQDDYNIGMAMELQALEMT